MYEFKETTRNEGRVDSFLESVPTKTIDVQDLLTGDELEQVTNILLEALAREKGLTADVFEIETNVISDHFINSEDYE